MFTNSSRAKQATAAAAVVAVLAAFYWALRPKPVPIDVAQVVRATMRVSIDEEGKTRIKDVYVVSAPISGRVLRLALDPGDAVHKDSSIVAVLQPATPPFIDARTRTELEAQAKAAGAAVDLAEAEVRQAESEFRFAEQELTRAKRLSQSSTISVRAFDKAVTDVEARKAALERARASVDLRKRELDSALARLGLPEENKRSGNGAPECCVEVRAPVTGRILKVLTKSEQVVSSGTPLVEIGNPANLEIIVDLLSADAVRIREGAPAVIAGWGGNKDLHAVVRRIEPSGYTKVSALGIEEQRVRTVLDLTDPHSEWSSLGHDYRILARIEAWSAEQVSQVPLSALFRRGEQWAVFKAVGGRAQLTTVEIGHRNSRTAEIIAGLAPGEAVVLHPSDRVLDGVRVTVRDSESIDK